VALVGLIYLGCWNATRSNYELTVLPLNGGHSILVDAPGKAHDWLIDCGNTNSVEFVLKPFLHAQGVNRMPRLVLTHGDLQHVGGAEAIREEFRVNEILTSAVRFRSPAYRRIVAGIEGNPHAHKLINRGDDVGSWSVLHPAADDDASQADDAALVLLGTLHTTRVLLLSDLGRRGQEVLLSRSDDLRADIVVTGLPAQTEPISDALLDAVQPKVIIVADSEYPATERAKPALRARLEAHGVPIFYTRNAGTTMITIGPKGWQLRAANDQRRAE
jgi:competence protein ComEC